MRVGEIIYHNKRYKKIISLPKNTQNETFIIWESPKPSPSHLGGCIIALWNEWIQEGKNEEKREREAKMYVVVKRKRRGTTAVRYY